MIGLPPPRLAEVIHLRGRCVPRTIGYLNSIIDAYEGLAVLRTIDPEAGEVVFWVTRKESPTLRSVLKELAKTIPLEVEADYV